MLTALSVTFHNDLILSKAEREGNIVLWSITGFSSTHPPPSPLSAPTVRDLDNDTRSAFCSPTLSSTEMYTRLLQFAIPDTDVMFMRFGFFPGHGIPGSDSNIAFQKFGGGRGGPILAMCNSASKISFWDFTRLEEHAKYLEAAQANPDSRRPAFLVPFRSRNRGGKATNPINRLTSGGGRASPSESERSSTIAESGISGSVEGERKMSDAEKSREIWTKRYGIGRPQMELLPHKEEVVKNLSFVGRQVAWSVGGEWCVVVGSAGVISVLERWNGK